MIKQLHPGGEHYCPLAGVDSDVFRSAIEAIRYE